MRDFMPLRISATDSFLRYAHNFARDGEYVKAVAVITKIKSRALNSNNLEKIALIHSYGGQLQASEACWLEIERRNEMKSGGYLMLASLQMELAKFEQAMESLEKEIQLSKITKNQYYVDSAVIRLAFLQIQMKDYLSARATLTIVNDEQGDFIPGIGYMTKIELLTKIPHSGK
jgi:tetratricopeptide (TPR) repeat protein